jgi:hypothetical protein
MFVIYIFIKVIIKNLNLEKGGTLKKMEKAEVLIKQASTIYDSIINESDIELKKLKETINNVSEASKAAKLKIKKL